MSSERGRKIANNIMLFTIGNFGSRILMFIMVIVYTHYIDTASLGYYDLIISTISFASPFVHMAFTDGIYRWLIGSDPHDRDYIGKVIATCNKAVITTTSITTIVIIIMGAYLDVKYYIPISALLVSTVLYQLNLEALRGMSYNRLYAASGLFNSVVCLSLELFGLIILKGGILVLLNSRTLSNIMAIVLIFYKQENIRTSIAYKFDVKIFKEIVAYSLPLIPNMVSWWIVNSSDRYIIAGVLGTEANGIYSVSNKFPTMVTVITSVIQMALQEALIKEYDADDRDSFFSKLFEKYYIFLFSIITCAIPITKIVILFFVSDEYKSAWLYIGFLYLSTVFSALSMYHGVGYAISKDTKRSVRTTVIAAISNLVVNVVLIRIIGLHAASFSTLISYMILFLARSIHSKKYFRIKVSWVKFIIMICASAFALLVTYTFDIMINLVFAIICIGAFLIINRSLIESLINHKSIKSSL